MREMGGTINSNNKDNFFGKLQAYDEDATERIKKKIKILSRKGEITIEGHGVSQKYILGGD